MLNSQLHVHIHSSFLSHSHRDPSTKDGTSCREADEGWDILPAQITLATLYYAEESTTCTHTF